MAVFGPGIERVGPGGVDPRGCPPGPVVAVFAPGIGRGVNPWGRAPGVVVTVFGPKAGRVLPGEANPGGRPPGTPVAVGPVRGDEGARVVGLPSVVAPGSAAAWIGAGGGAAGGGAFSAPLLTRVTTAFGNAALNGAPKR
jgi:hypothetical protein